MMDFNNETELLNIQPFNPIAFSTGTTLILGKRGCGKTELIKHIISLQPPNKEIYYYNPILNDDFNYELFLDSVKENKNGILAIWDDINFRNTSFEKYLMLSNNYNITNILTCQCSTILHPQIRCNIDRVLFFEEDNISVKKRNYDYYGGCIKNFKVFNELFTRCAKKIDDNVFRLFVIDSSKVFYYKYSMVDIDLTKYKYVPEESEKSEKIIDNNERIQLIKQILEQNTKLIEILSRLS